MTMIQVNYTKIFWNTLMASWGSQIVPVMSFSSVILQPLYIFHKYIYISQISILFCYKPSHILQNVTQINVKNNQIQQKTEHFTQFWVIVWLQKHNATIVFTSNKIFTQTSFYNLYSKKEQNEFIKIYLVPPDLDGSVEIAVRTYGSISVI